jgi:hypothetical protein
MLGAVLTFFGTTWIANKYQEKSWRNDKACEIWKNELGQTQEVINSTTNLLKKRYYYSYLLISTNTDDPHFAEYFNLYRLVVAEWNTQLTTYRDNIKNLLGEEIAYKILDKTNGRESDNCLHCWYSKINDVINLKINNPIKFTDFMNKHEISKDNGDLCDDIIIEMNSAFKNKYDQYYKMIGIEQKK